MTLSLGIDVGSTTTKVALVDVRGGRDVDAPRVLRVAQVRTPDTSEGLRDALSELVRGCTAGADGAIAAIGVASMAETGIPLGPGGEPLAPFQRWDRAAGREHLDRLREQHPDLLTLTGLPATPKPTLVALHRLRARQPDAFARLARWQGVADHVTAMLTGAHATDHTLAARTMLRRRGAREWDAELVAAAGIGPDVLPRILDTGEAAGRTTRAAAAFGLPAGIPVHIAGHDHAVGAWAAGVRRSGEAADSLGTAEAVLVLTDEAAPAAVDDGFSLGRSVDDRCDTVMGGSPACGALLADWPAAVADVLAEADPGHWPTSPVTVLPYPRGRQCPAPDPGAVLETIGSAGPGGSTPADPSGAYALLQSLVLHSRWMREVAAAHAGRRVDRVVLLGSLASRFPVWGPLAAAAARSGMRGGTAVARSATREPVAAGAALLAAVRAHLAADDAALPVAEVAPATAAGWEEAYDRFVAAALASSATRTPPPAAPAGSPTPDPRSPVLDPGAP